MNQTISTSQDLDSFLQSLCSMFVHNLGFSELNRICGKLLIFKLEEILGGS
jgi:hypothetical protein